MNKDCNQCGGSGLVADVPTFPKPAWEAWENRPRGGPDPMTDFVTAIPCPTCFPEHEDQLVELRRLKELAIDAHDYERAANLRDQIDRMKADHPIPPEPNVELVTRVLTLGTQLRAKAVEYRRKVELLDSFVAVAEALTPDSDAERAFVDFIRTQGVDL